MAVTDQTSDRNGQALHRLTNLYEIPEFVKAASSADITGTDRQLPPEAFGDPRTRQFPTHTPAAVFTSYMYFLDARPGLDKMAALVEERIRTAGRYFGIEPLLDKLQEKHAADARHSVNDLPDDDFAAIMVYDGGRKERHLPMRNPGEVKAACQFLHKHRTDFVYADRRVIAERVLRKAAQIGGVDGADEQWLYKQAGWACGPAEKAAEMLFERAKALRLLKKDPELQVELTKAAMTCVEHPTLFHPPEQMQKVALFMDAVDREYGFQGIATMGEPEDLFAFTVKEAADLVEQHVQLTTGTVYKKADLGAFDLDAIRDIMGDEFAARVTVGGFLVDTEKLAEELATLPRGDARLFDQLAEAVQVAPVVKQASAPESTGFLAAMAALHAPG